MSWTEKVRGWLSGRTGSTAGGPVGGRVTTALKTSPESLADDPSDGTNTEQLVGTAVLTTALRLDSKSEPAIRKAQSAVVAAAGATHNAVADVERERREDVQRGRLRRIKEQDQRNEEMLDAPIDHAAPLVSHRVVTGAEILLGLVESGFWYLVFSASIDRRVGLISSQRLSAIGLALFIPVLGILAARFAGPAWQRVLRYPAVEKHLRRNQIAAAVAATLLLGAAGLAAWYLVSWRYSKNNPSNIFAVLPPGWCMALLFVGSIVTLALLRAFSDSEQHTNNKARDATVAADQLRAKQAHDRLTAACVAWANEWTTLRQLVNVGLNEVERIVATGEHIMLHNRGRHADASRTQPATGVEPPSETHVHWHLDINLITTRLRVHASAAQTLADYQPPTVRPDQQLADRFPVCASGQVDDLNARINTLLGDLTQSSRTSTDPQREPLADDTPASSSQTVGETNPSPVPKQQFITRVNGHDRTSTTS